MFLPAERTGAVIGKNGRMKHLIKVYIPNIDFLKNHKLKLKLLILGSM